MVFLQRTAYYFPILESLKEFGGREKAEAIINQVKLKVENLLTPDDYSAVPSSGEMHYINSIRWARQELIEFRLLNSNAQFGFWELTESGKEILSIIAKRCFNKSQFEKGEIIKKYAIIFHND